MLENLRKMFLDFANDSKCTRNIIDYRLSVEFLVRMHYISYFGIMKIAIKTKTLVS